MAVAAFSAAVPAGTLGTALAQTAPTEVAVVGVIADALGVPVAGARIVIVELGRRALSLRPDAFELGRSPRARTP